jgi:DNA-binding MarR family transcriptional regulator
MSRIVRKSMDIVNHSRRRPEDEVLELVHTVMHQVRSQQYRVLRARGHDLTHMESKVLIYVSRHPDGTQRDMARDTGRDKAQLARLIKNLRERGLVASQVDPTDRRNQRLSLTADGRSVLHELQRQSTRLATQAAAALSATEVRQLVTLLRQVQGSLATQAANDAGARERASLVRATRRSDGGPAQPAVVVGSRRR